MTPFAAFAAGFILGARCLWLALVLAAEPEHREPCRGCGRCL